MSRLTICSAVDASIEAEYMEAKDITRALEGAGVLFEQWRATRPLTAQAGQEDVLAAYSDDVERLKQKYGFQSADVVALTPDHPDREALRAKFLDEHTHSDFEVRFFVDGKGLFYIHQNDRVFMVLCEKGDLISVPANTTHWFDMGTAPSFKCIRLFTTAEGWVASMTGSDIASRFPYFDEYINA